MAQTEEERAWTQYQSFLDAFHPARKGPDPTFQELTKTVADNIRGAMARRRSLRISSAEIHANLPVVEEGTSRAFRGAPRYCVRQACLRVCDELRERCGLEFCPRELEDDGLEICIGRPIKR